LVLRRLEVRMERVSRAQLGDIDDGVIVQETARAARAGRGLVCVNESPKR